MPAWRSATGGKSVVQQMTKLKKQIEVFVDVAVAVPSMHGSDGSAIEALPIFLGAVK